MDTVNIKKKSKRIFYIDEIRALAILFVILIHTSNYFTKEATVHSLFWSFSSSLAAFGTIGVPLFFMISGTLLLNRKYDNIMEFYKKRVSRIAIPFAFWIIFIIYVKIAFFDAPFTFDGICRIAVYKGFPWFFWTLLGLYLFTPVINSYIREYKIKGCEIFLVIWIFTMILNTFGLYPIKNVELRYFSGYLGYMVLGWYLSNKDFKLSNKSMMICAIIIFLISTTIDIHCILNKIEFPAKYYLTILPIFQASGIYLFFMSIDNLSETYGSSLISKIHNFVKTSRISKIILSISVCSYGMYLTHYFVLWVFIYYDKTYHFFLRNPFKWIPFIFLLAVLGSWMLIWVMSKVPVLKKFSGV